ncbi:MAG: hypothetical protein GF317_15340 [Candidatus Lokiarchaeota archaeon]|nr:hypothetical protein [Candidatus Lokiarchaeota archaeon]
MATEEKEDKAWEAYERIKGALDGLYEILNLSFEEDNIFYQCGMDNLEKLKDIIVDMASNEYSSNELKYKIRELEFDMKKCLFFEGDKKQSEKSKKSNE